MLGAQRGGGQCQAGGHFSPETKPLAPPSQPPAAGSGRKKHVVVPAPARAVSMLSLGRPAGARVVSGFCDAPRGPRPSKPTDCRFDDQVTIVIFEHQVRSAKSMLGRRSGPLAKPLSILARTCGRILDSCHLSRLCSLPTPDPPQAQGVSGETVGCYNLIPRHRSHFYSV